ncbi:MAG: peptidoglycan-binding domain-containing protein [Candidatus Omnitrophica bacterium]|nr:peptidoglycan-binding domain-containing protein [Candidatus Omnitrophota bacterium]
MKRGLMLFFAAALVVVPLAVVGCKGKVDKEADMAKFETTEAMIPVEDVEITQTSVTEPSATQVISQETIPPTASVPPAADSAAPGARQDNLSRNKDIQTALKAANFYTGNIDGKIGPKTKRAIVGFQKANGLKADGKVGPKTWAELEKYLTVQQ